jgi:hypothetical protein
MTPHRAADLADAPAELGVSAPEVSDRALEVKRRRSAMARIVTPRL